MAKWRSRMGFTLIEVAAVLLIVLLITALALPAFKRYVRRSKTSEAVMNVRRLFDASVTYFEIDYATRTGSMLARTFPATTARTPSTAACGLEADKITPDNAYWTGATWQALTFSVDDPFYYLYSYESAGTDTAASFSARAEGDLTCDGTFSMFERVGHIDADRNVQGGAGLYKHLPLE